MKRSGKVCGVLIGLSLMGFASTSTAQSLSIAPPPTPTRVHPSASSLAMSPTNPEDLNSARMARLPSPGNSSPILSGPIAQGPSNSSRASTHSTTQNNPLSSNRSTLQPSTISLTEWETRLRALEESHRRQEEENARLRGMLEEKESESANSFRNASISNTEAPEHPSEGYVVGSDLTMKAFWKNGLEIESANHDFRLHVGGRTQFDAIWLQSDATGLNGAGGVGDQDAVGFRRARLRVDGTMYETIEWAAEYDFVNGTNDNVGLQPASETNVTHVTAPTDLWFNFKELPIVGNLRIGNFKEQIGMEHLTSSRYLDFLERSFNQDAYTGPFNNGFSPGVMIFNWTENERATWAIGAFKNTTNAYAYNVGEGEYAATGRVTWLPYYDEPTEGRYLWHVGLSGSVRDPDQGRVRIRSRGSLRNGPGALNPVLADSGFFNADLQSLIGAETAMNIGPMTLQAEYMGSWADDAWSGANQYGTYYTQGYYVQGLYFLTGEHRVYDRKAGVFTRVSPSENFFRVRDANGGVIQGSGAWQVGLRYSQLDLRDSGLDGGVVQDVTLGLNWFLNPNLKLQWNYVYTRRDGSNENEGDVYGFGMRLAHDF